MRKKLLKIFVTLFICFLAFGFVACKNGKDGTNGKNAYELYCELHPDYAGTMEEWLESLKNDDTAESLRYQKIAGKEEFCVMGIGTVSSLDIIVADTYNDLPVTEISPYAFENEINITSVTLPQTITKIGEAAFSNCNSLTSINIPARITTINKETFQGCCNLTSINLPDNITYIGVSAFSNCNNLKTINLPDNITSIASSAFSNCSSLTSITIPDNIVSIESLTFSGCNNLTSVIIPDSVISIGLYSFYDCSNLTKIYYEGTAENWNNIVIASEYNPLNSVICYYYSEDEPELNSDETAYNGNYWRYKNDAPTVWIYNIED